MAKRERLPWIKLWGSYAESPTLAGLDGSTRWVGVCLMLLVRTASDMLGERTTWAVHPDGVPLTVRDIAGYAHVTTSAAKSGLTALERRRFVSRREDGAYGLPKFWEYQETADAKRKRDGKASGKSGADSVQEDRGESSSLRSEPPDPPQDLEPDPLDLTAKRVLAYLNAALVRLGEPGKCKTTKFIRARLADGADEADLVLVIDCREDECRRKPANVAYLNPQTPFLPTGWERTLAFARAWKRNAKPSGPRLDLDSDALERKRREAEEFDREHRPWLFESTPERSPEEPA